MLYVLNFEFYRPKMSGTGWLDSSLLYTHCLVPKCETNAPAYPVSMLTFSKVDLMTVTASLGDTGPLK